MANLRKWAIAIAIAIVFNLFANYAISVFYKAPQYNDFCKEQALRTAQYANTPYAYQNEPQTQLLRKDCTPVEVRQELKNNCSEQKGYIDYRYNATGCPTEAYCELCEKQFNDVNQPRNSNIFIILIAVGIIAVIAGFIVKADAVSTGFLIGGVLSMVIAAIRTWGQLQNVIRLVILGAALVALIWFGYRKAAEGGGPKPKAKLGK